LDFFDSSSVSDAWFSDGIGSNGYIEGVVGRGEEGRGGEKGPGVGFSIGFGVSETLLINASILEGGITCLVPSILPPLLFLDFEFESLS
jgi:hypothetical protein